MAKIVVWVGFLLALGAMAVWLVGRWDRLAFGTGYVPIAPVTAALLGLLGATILLLERRKSERLENLVGGGAVVVVTMVAGAVLLRGWLGRNWPWDGWLAPSETVPGGLPIGVMSPVTAATFLALCAAVAARRPAWRNLRVAGWVEGGAVGVGLLVSLVVLLGYASGAPVGYGTKAVPMALLTAIEFGLLNVGLLGSSSFGQWLRQEWLLSNDPALSKDDRAFRLRVGGTTMAFVVVMALGAFFFVRTQRAEEKARAVAQIQAVQELKAAQLAQWREERLGEARFLSRTTAVAEDVAGMMDQPVDATARERVLRWLRPIKGGDRYSAVWLVDRAGRPVISVPEDARVPTPEEVEAALSGEGARCIDLHESVVGDAFELHFVAPVLRTAHAGGATGDVMGAIILSVDPRTHLFPMLAARTAGTETEETLLVRTDGRGLVYLADAPGRKARAGRPRTDTALAGAYLGEGERMRELRDDRGVPVLAGVRPLPESPWRLVTKLDQSEVYAATGREVWQMTALVGTLFLAGSFFTAAMWRRRRLGYLTRTLEAEAERNALAVRLAVLLQQANDIIILMDDQDRIVEANQRALDTYDYTLAELQALPPGGLRTADARGNFHVQREALNSPEGAIFETVHQRKDGTTFPVEVSGRSLELGGRRYKLGIFRDITQRRAHEEQIARLTRVHAALSHVNQAIVRAKDRTSLLNEICRVLVQHGEFSMAWIGGEAEDHVRIVPLAVAGDRSDYLAGIEIFSDERPEGCGPTGRAFREGRCYVCNDIFADPATAPWRERASRAGFAATLALPIEHGGRVAAVLTVHSTVRGFFGEKEIELLEEAAQDVSFALENLEREIQRQRAEAELLNAQRDFAKAFIASPTAVSVNTLAEGRFLDVNEAWERLSGFRREEAVGRTTVELGLWDDLREREEVRRRIDRDGRVRGLEISFLRKNREPLTCLLSAEVIGFGGEACILATIVDITELQRAAAAVRMSEERFRAVFENALDGFILGRPDGAALAANPAACRMLGRTEEEIIRGGRVAIVAADDPRAAQLIEQRTQTGRACGEMTMVRGDGSRFEAEVSSVIFSTDEGPRTSLVMRDVTERRRAQAALRWEQNLFERLVSSIPDRIYFKDRNGRFLRVNAATLRALGCSDQAAVEGRSDADYFTAKRARRTSEDEQAIMRTGVPLVGIEEEETWLDGRVTWVATTKMPLLDPDGVMIGILGVSRDITEHKERSRRIREQAELIDKANEAIIVADLENRITFWSRGAERMLGWRAEEVVGHAVAELLGFMGIAVTSEIEQGLLALGDWRGEVHGRDRHGTAKALETSITVLRDEQGRPTGRLSISGDITEKKKLADQFLRAQRLESLGMLAAGIAHDMNNVLAPIGMAAPLLRVNASDERDLRLLETLEKCAERGAGLARQILGFAHGVGGEPRLVQVKHLLRDVIAVVTETFPKSISIQDHVPTDLWPVLANPTQIHQVLLNLCVNARDAMPQGGVLRVSAENVRLDAAAAEQLPGSHAGRWLMIHVQDTGTGIPPEVLPHIWEPFFTTKAADKGTGLGLATVRGIVEGHRGFLWLKTEVGQGTTFRVYFPAAEGDATVAAGVGAAPRGEDELILLVDDEKFIRQTATAILTRYGYRVVVASDGAEALALFAQRPGEFKLLVTDRDMPLLDGDALVAAVRRLKPAMKILYVSGLGNGPVGATTRASEDGTLFLAKPFKIDELLTAVQRALHAPPPGPT